MVVCVTLVGRHIVSSIFFLDLNQVAFQLWYAHVISSSLEFSQCLVSLFLFAIYVMLSILLYSCRNVCSFEFGAQKTSPNIMGVLFIFSSTKHAQRCHYDL